MAHDPQVYDDLAEAAWRWVRRQVRRDDRGPWLPPHVDVDTGGQPVVQADDDERVGAYDGLGGLAHVLAELRLGRGWSDEEAVLAAEVGDAVRAHLPAARDVSVFGGTASDLDVLLALDPSDRDAARAAVDRLLATWTEDGWPAPWASDPERFRPGAVVVDASLGSACGVLSGLWAVRHGVEEGREVVERGLASVLRFTTGTDDPPGGVEWPFVPDAFRVDPTPFAMPNWSHGQAGVVGVLALAGQALGRDDVLDLAGRGAERLVALADTSDDGFVVPRVVPWAPRHGDPVTWNWCHGAPGTSRAFVALARAGVEEVAGCPTLEWHDRALRSTLASGIPQRLHPGFWDNDGRCCGTAGTADILLDAWRRTGRQEWLDFVVVLADALVEHAVRDGDDAYWRFVEHRAEPPLLRPGVGWMQGAAGIAALLLRVARVLRDGREAPAVARLDSWWCVD